MSLWTVARQAPLFMGFSRQEYWSGFQFPSPGDFPNPVIEPRSPAVQADSLPTAITEATCICVCVYVYACVHVYINVSVGAQLLSHV